MVQIGGSRRTLSPPSRTRPIWPERSSLAGALVFAIRAFVCIALGTALGLALTVDVVRHGTSWGAIRIGPWRFAQGAGTPDIDPYRLAHFAHTGEVPMAAGVGATFVATEDDRGRRLDRACSYQLAGGVPQALFWTVEAADGNGFSLGSPELRHGFTSAELLRASNGTFTIQLSSTPRPGNWIPLAGTGPLTVVLRLYDTSIGALGSRELRQIALPTITAQSCA
jgi:hypothetical protein